MLGEVRRVRGPKAPPVLDQRVLVGRLDERHDVHRRDLPKVGVERRLRKQRLEPVGEGVIAPEPRDLADG